MSYEFEKYICTKETLQETIETFGVAIIPQVLDDSECQQMVNQMWDFVEHISQLWEQPIRRDDESTWKEFYKMYPTHSMLLQYFGVGHSQASWNVRQNPKIVDIFAYFWKCLPEELLVSFDGLSFHLPPEITNRGWFRGNTWYHTDQSYLTPEFRCIQGLVTGIDINDNDATLSIMESSHLHHREMQEKYQITNKDNWYKISEEQHSFYSEKGCCVKNIKCPKGSMVFWDSRTIHCGVECNKNRKLPNIRAVIYVCCMPRSISTEADLKKKRKAFQDLRTTSHYPCKIKLFNKKPHTFGKQLPPIQPVPTPHLTELGLKLAGF